ncbi:MAG: hypothetical protein N3D20_01610 [Candidatus Pacearchaeota archaeon]|nr:hypothetical protein [Candidatus Pacearchaeota archaeon]
MKKEIYLAFIVGVTFILFVKNVSALGIMPAIREFNFEPGKRYTITYTIINEDSKREINLYVGGDFAKYASLSKKSFIGSDSFSVTINLPDKWDKPGKNILTVGAKETPKEDEMISTVIAIEAVVYIYVPYPGKYIDAILNIPNCNVGDIVPVEIRIINRGTETIVPQIRLNFYDKEKNLVYQTEFEQKTIESGIEKVFNKVIDSSEFKPGDYLVEAVIDYANDKKILNKTFRVGSLSINVKNFTKKIESGGLKKYYIDIESLWNDYITKIYADVNVSNSTFSTTFRTPPNDLPGWGERRLEGYLDTTGMIGKYNSEIILYFEDKNMSINGELEVYKEKRFNNTLLIIVAIIIGLVIISVIYYLIIRWKIQKKKK